MRNRTIIPRLVCTVLAAVTLAGCAPFGKGTEAGASRGGWTEQTVLKTTIHRGDLVDDPQVHLLQREEVLYLTLPGSKTSLPAVFCSRDDGASWEPAGEWTAAECHPKGVEVQEYTLDADGTPWMLAMEPPEDLEMYGRFKLFRWENGEWNERFAPDVSGEKFSDFCALENGLLAMFHQPYSSEIGVELYDPASGESRFQELAFGRLQTDGSTLLSLNYETAGILRENVVVSSVTAPGILLGSQEGELYAWVSYSVQKQNEDGEWTELIPPEDCPALQLPESNPQNLFKTKDGSLLVMDIENLGTDAELRLYRYRWDPSLKQEEPLRVYSFYNSDVLRRGIAAFCQAYPGTRVRYETKAQFKLDNPTFEEMVSDEAERLRQELQNGAAPDLVVLDGLLDRLSVEELAQSGLVRPLEDISFDSLLPAARMGQETPYAVPLRIQLPTMWFRKGTQLPGELSAFADRVAAGPHYDISELLGQMLPDGLPVWAQMPSSGAAALYLASRPELVKDDSLDMDAMEEFLRMAEKMVILSDPYEVWQTMGEESLDDWLSGLLPISGEDLNNGEAVFASGGTFTFSSLRPSRDGGRYPLCPAPIPSLGQQVVYIPSLVTVLPKNGDERAQSLLGILLNDRMQRASGSTAMDTGLPVNTAALDIVCEDAVSEMERWGSNGDGMLLLVQVAAQADTPVLAVRPFDEPAARAVMHVLTGQSAEDAMERLRMELEYKS